MSDSEDEMMGCQAHRSARHGSCVQCYPVWMFEKTGQFCLRHYLYYPNTICKRALFCHVATVVPPENNTGLRVVTSAVRSLCLTIAQEGCGFSLRRWFRDFRTSFVARNIRYRGENFWRVFPDDTGREDEVPEETRLQDWRHACADFLPMADDDGEFGLLSPIQANPQPAYEVPYSNDGYVADDEDECLLGSSGSTEASSLTGRLRVSSDSSSTLSDVLHANFMEGYPGVPYRRSSWQ